MVMGQDDGLNEDEDENRRLGAAMVANYRELQNTLMQMAVGLGKWVLASLLAVNGAAAVATWQANMP